MKGEFEDAFTSKISLSFWAKECCLSEIVSANLPSGGQFNTVFYANTGC